MGQLSLPSVAMNEGVFETRLVQNVAMTAVHALVTCLKLSVPVPPRMGQFCEATFHIFSKLPRFARSLLGSWVVAVRSHSFVSQFGPLSFK